MKNLIEKIALSDKAAKVFSYGFVTTMLGIILVSALGFFLRISSPEPQSSVDLLKPRFEDQAAEGDAALYMVLRRQAVALERIAKALESSQPAAR